MRVWDLTSCQQVGEPLFGHTDWVRAVATAVLDCRPVAVSGGGDGSVRVWDLTTRQQIGAPSQGHYGWVYAVATGVVDGRPVAVTGGEDAAVCVWDLATGRPVGEKSVFPSAVGAVALDDRLVVGFASDVAVLRRRRPGRTSRSPARSRKGAAT